MNEPVYNRRALLRLGAGALIALSIPLPALAEDDDPKTNDPKLRFISIPPLLLPGREQYAFIRIAMQLVVRRSEKLPVESALVTTYMPRIVGLLTEQLPANESLTRRAGPTELALVKHDVRNLANSVIGQPVVEDVLIVSFLTG